MNNFNKFNVHWIKQRKNNFSSVDSNRMARSFFNRYPTKIFSFPKSIRLKTKKCRCRWVLIKNNFDLIIVDFEIKNVNSISSMTFEWMRRFPFTPLLFLSMTNQLKGEKIIGLIDWFLHQIEMKINSIEKNFFNDFKIKSIHLIEKTFSSSNAIQFFNGIEFNLKTNWTNHSVDFHIEQGIETFLSMKFLSNVFVWKSESIADWSVIVFRLFVQSPRKCSFSSTLSSVFSSL